MFRTGDILVFTDIYLISQVLDKVVGTYVGHSYVVLKSNKLGEISREVSPTDTYVLVYPKRIWSIELFISKLWNRWYTDTMYYLKRTDPMEYTDDFVYNIATEETSYEGNIFRKTQRYLQAYFKIGTDNTSLNSCSEEVMNILKKLGTVHQEAIISNIIPHDIIHGKFYQVVEYQRSILFNKKENYVSKEILNIIQRNKR